MIQDLKKNTKMIHSILLPFHIHMKEIILNMSKEIKYQRRYDKCNVLSGDTEVNPGFEIPELQTWICNEYKKVYKVDNEIEIRTQCWINKYNPGAFQEPHTHGRTMHSWCYLTKIPSGNLVILKDNEPKIYNTEGLVVFFPNNMTHYVTENKSDDLRISVAGDIVEK